MDKKPENLADILRALPKGTPFFVPIELLALWFPPGVVSGTLAPETQKSAEEYGTHFNCLFFYEADQQQGCFTKQAPN
jgi:hypothetical protein